MTAQGPPGSRGGPVVEVRPGGWAVPRNQLKTSQRDQKGILPRSACQRHGGRFSPFSRVLGHPTAQATRMRLCSVIGYLGYLEPDLERFHVPPDPYLDEAPVTGMDCALHIQHGTGDAFSEGLDPMVVLP